MCVSNADPLEAVIMGKPLFSLSLIGLLVGRNIVLFPRHLIVHKVLGSSYGSFLA